MRFTNIVALTLASAMAVVKADMIYHCTQPNTIALTFDDGPYEYTNELLDHLKSAGIHATFFINGLNWWGDVSASNSKKNVLARAAAEGHQIASHTWEHEIPSSRDKLKESLVKIENLVKSSTGKRPTYFRAPKGECDENCIAYIESLGYKIIQWDTDTNDWNYEFNGVANRSKRVGMVKKFLTNEWKKNKSNYLVLMHDVQQHTVQEIIPWLVKNAPFNKYKFVTVAECLGDNTKGMVGNGKTQTAKDAPQAPQAAPANNQSTAPSAQPANTNNNNNNVANTNTTTNKSNTTNTENTNINTTANTINTTTNTDNTANTINTTTNTDNTANTINTTNNPITNTANTDANNNSPVLSNVISGNSTVESNLNNNNQTSDALNTASNLYLIATLLVYSLYMVL